MDGKAILDRHEELRQLRSPYEGDWRDIAALISPDDRFDQSTPQLRDDVDVYDATPLYALDDFASGIFSKATNPAERWFELTIGDEDMAQWGPAKQYLYDVATLAFRSLSPAVSTFYAVAPAVFGGVGAFGLGSMAQEERVGEGRISDRAVPLGSTYIDTDVDGEVTAFNNELSLRGSQVKRFVARQGGAVPDHVKDDRTYVVVHATWENPDANPRRPGMQYLPWRTAYVSPDIRDWELPGGAYECPYTTIQWDRRAGRLYPRGPGHVARPDAGTLNELERSHIVRAQYDAEPPLALADEDTLEAADIYPGAILYGAMSKTGKRAAEWLERRGNVGMSREQSQQRREAIRRAFRFGLTQLLADRPQMTATEFLGFQQQELELLGPHLVIMQTGLSHFIKRRLGILARAGQLPPPPREIGGQLLGIKYVSPLAQAQQMAEARGVIQLQQSVEQLAATDPRARDWFDADVAVPALGPAFTNRPGIIRSPDAVREIRQQRAAEERRQAELEAAGKQAEVAATAAHAAQAATLANDRGRRA